MALEHHKDNCNSVPEAAKATGIQCKTCAIDLGDIESWDDEHQFSALVEEFPDNKSSTEIATILGWTVAHPSAGIDKYSRSIHSESIYLTSNS